MLATILTKPSLNRLPQLSRCTTCRSVASLHTAVPRSVRTRAQRFAKAEKAAKADAESAWAADSPTDVIQGLIRQSEESDALRAARKFKPEQAEGREGKAEQRNAEPDWSWGSAHTTKTQVPAQRAGVLDPLPTFPSTDITASESPAQAATPEKATVGTAEEQTFSEKLFQELIQGHHGPARLSQVPGTLQDAQVSQIPSVRLPPDRTAMIGVFGSDNDAYANAPLAAAHRYRPYWNGVRLKMSFTSRSPAGIPESWLRDHCQCSQCFHPVTKQRQINIFTLKDKASFTISRCIVGDTSVEIDWQDGHHSHYPIHLFKNSDHRDWEAYRRGLDMSPRLWNASIGKQPPAVDYDSVQRNGLGELLRQIRIFGFCFVPNCPVSPEATQSLLEMIGPIRNTHYGGFYDFTSDMASKDTAYTDLALEAHTDTTYFSEPAGLQAFHMLSHTDGEGGRSLLVDGFNAANELLHADEVHYERLSTEGVYAHASGNEDVSIQPYTAFPVLEHDRLHAGHLCRIRWNNSDRAGFRMPIYSTKSWYDAAGRFNDILASSRNQYWFQLQPGTPLIFDNWRVLHGRSAFTGKRRMCGAYINHDDFISKYKLTNYDIEDVVASTITG